MASPVAIHGRQLCSWVYHNQTLMSVVYCDVRGNLGCWWKYPWSCPPVCLYSLYYLLHTLCAQAAHVGIGISGVEGLQASCASDYSIAQVCYGKINVVFNNHLYHFRLHGLCYFCSIVVTIWIKIATF